MALEKSLIAIQRMLGRAWQLQSESREIALSQNEFDYLMCIYDAQNVEYDHDNQQHDDSSHLSALAGQMQVRKSSASLMVNKLEKKGLIQRVTCRYDARAQHILLTEKGEQLLLTARELVYSAVAQGIEDKLGKAETGKLQSLLQKATES